MNENTKKRLIDAGWSAERQIDAAEVIDTLKSRGFLLTDKNITKKELAKTKIELVEANDSTFVYKNKVGELYAARETYIADINQLKQTNEDLYEKYKNLKDHPIVIEKIKTIVKIDSIQVKDSLIADPVQNTYTAGRPAEHQ